MHNCDNQSHTLFKNCWYSIPILSLCYCTLDYGILISIKNRKCCAFIELVAFSQYNKVRCQIDMAFVSYYRTTNDFFVAVNQPIYNTMAYMFGAQIQRHQLHRLVLHINDPVRPKRNHKSKQVSSNIGLTDALSLSNG